MDFKKESIPLKKGMKKFWFFLWKDDSFKGWLVSMIVLLIFVKFIFFPFLYVITGTDSPVVIVISCSMYHQGNLFSNYDNWWKSHGQKYSSFNITKKEFKNFKFKNGFNKGDILVVVGVKPKNVKIGNIIVFKTNQNIPVIHRVVEITKDETTGNYVFETEGDNNPTQLVPSNNPMRINEKDILGKNIIGKAKWKIAPYLGWIKLIFYDWKNPPYERGLCKAY